MFKLKVNREACIACGMCALECNVLQEDSSGKVEVVGAGVVADLEVGKVRNIVELCPSGALTLTQEFEDVSKKNFLAVGFFSFRTKDTDYINDRQEHSNDWLAGRIKEHLKPASEFYTCVRTDKTYDYVTVSHWFGEDTREKKYSYAYYIKPDSVARFYRDVARATWKAGKYTKQFCERELERFHKEIAQEWNEKISYLLRQI